MNILGTFGELAIASAAFVGLHMFMSSAAVRQPMTERLGVWPFRIVYSVISGVCFTWMIMAFNEAPRVELFDPGIGLKHLSLSVMAVACFLLVCGYTQANPTAVGMESAGLKAGAVGVLKVTRHPVMWGVALWALSHLLANGHVAAVIFFGSLAFLAIAGASHIDKNRQTQRQPGWDQYREVTSHVPMLAILKGKTRVERGEYRWWQILLSVALYLGFIVAHEPLFGYYVMPF